MNLFTGTSAFTAAIAALSLGACASTPSTTHLHGPKSPPMQNADMKPTLACTVDGTHPMPGPRGSTMSKEAHPGCRPTQATKVQ